MSKAIKHSTVVKCPICKFKNEVDMPDDSRQLLYDCKECSARLKPKSNECCVFCSYGSIPCPPTQLYIIESQLKRGA